MQPLDLLTKKFLGQGHGRELRGVQDFVRISIADSTEQPGISNRSLQRMVAAGERLTKCAQGTPKHFQSARVHRAQSCFAPDNVERGAPFGTRFREQQSPGSKIEGREANLSGELRS